MTDPPPLGAPYCHKRTTRAIAGRSRSHAVRSRRISGMRCPACRTENRPGVRFCEECGATLDVLCPACGAGVPTGKKFCGACGAPLAAAVPPAPAVASPRFESPRAYTPAHLAARILKDRAALSGERKQVSVLFADVSGFTSISERLDPEEVHALINRAFELMLAEIHRYEGTVNQFLGDGLMALFGAPIAHEDHAQRAAHAALAMQQTLARYRDELQATRARHAACRRSSGVTTRSRPWRAPGRRSGAAAGRPSSSSATRASASRGSSSSSGGKSGTR